MNIHYKLDGKEVVPCSMEEWARVFENTTDRRVGQTKITNDIEVSTVFLGIDHSWGSGPPLLFETMIFGGIHDQYQTRCSTWREAEDMHQLAVQIAESGLNGNRVETY